MTPDVFAPASRADNDGQFEPAWGVDLPGISEGGARSVVEWARQVGISPDGSVVNPTHFIQFSFDRTTAEWLLAVLMNGPFDVEDENGLRRRMSIEELRDRLEGITTDLSDFVTSGGASA